LKQWQRQRRRRLSAGPSWKSSMLFLVLRTETLFSHCEGVIKRVGGIVKAVEQSWMVVIHLHFLLRRPLTFSSGKETPCHSCDVPKEDECALNLSARGKVRVVTFYHQVESVEGNFVVMLTCVIQKFFGEERRKRSRSCRRQRAVSFRSFGDAGGFPSFHASTFSFQDLCDSMELSSSSTPWGL
jgi:hypothetical protein